LDLLRRLETDLTDDAVKALRDAADVEDIVLSQLADQIEAASYSGHARALHDHLASDRPWNGLAELALHVQALRELYRQRRASVLEKHQVEVERSLGRIKRCQGFDSLDVDQRELVLHHIRDGAPLSTSADAVAPPLEHLDAEFAARLKAAEAKALAQLDDLLESRGDTPTVNVELGLAGRELSTVRELERFLEELDERLRPEIASGHRVRLR